MERDPERFMRAFAAAVGAGGLVFLADPAWGEAERTALAACTAQPSLAPAGRGWLMIPSGGTSGRLKFARHDEATLGAAVRGFVAHFQARPVNGVGVLPLHHVSGLMAWLRCALTGGSYQPWDWKRLEAGEFPRRRPRPGPHFLSLVPTQLQRLMASAAAVEWLRTFEAVFVGGGPAWPELLEAAARARLPMALSYGMTETAAMATAQRPAEFRAGGRSSGLPLPHLDIALTAEGRVRVAGESVFHGYYPAWQEERAFVTEDLGRLDTAGGLEILGRGDALIITGGEKADPLEIERALRATGEFVDVAVIGLPDPVWGQAVVACFPAAERRPSLNRVAAALAALAPFKRPRHYLACADWPRNAQGKLNRAELARVAAGLLRTPPP
jgi:O-succinylbenzoic acid--CoA ligase